MESSADIQGAIWSAEAAEYAACWAPVADPAHRRILELTGIGPGTRLLDVGCGPGDFLVRAAKHGAAVTGIDAAPGMLDIARTRLPGTDLRQGPSERLPFADGSFDVVTAFNSLQFAADQVAALREMGRVGGTVAICGWGSRADQHEWPIIAALRELVPGEDATQVSAPPPLGEPGVLAGRVAEAGLALLAEGEIDTPLLCPDRAALERAFLFDARDMGAVEAAGEDAVRAAITRAAEPFALGDGSYRISMRFRYVVARLRRRCGSASC